MPSEVAHVSFADEMRAREVEARRIAASEVEARRLAEVGAAERLAEIGRLKCEMESESARALVVEQISQIARLTEQLELQRSQMQSASDEMVKSELSVLHHAPSLSKWAWSHRRMLSRSSR